MTKFSGVALPLLNCLHGTLLCFVHAIDLAWRRSAAGDAEQDPPGGPGRQRASGRHTRHRHQAEGRWQHQQISGHLGQCDLSSGYLANTAKHTHQSVLSLYVVM